MENPMRFLSPAVAIACLPLLLAGCSRSKSSPSGSVKIEPAFKVTADELVGDYRKNQIGADQKYKGKTIEITGKVGGIGKAPLLGYYVGLGSSQEGEYDVMCFLDADNKAAEEKAGQLKEGDTATLIGVCDGKPGGIALRIKYCFFPSPPAGSGPGK
jgi:tRNA_anti-like